MGGLGKVGNLMEGKMRGNFFVEWLERGQRHGFMSI